MAKKGVLRVGVLNNFNFTDDEFKQLSQYDDDWLIFVNANAHCKISGEYPVVLTTNPDLEHFIEPQGDLNKLKAVRIKYVSGARIKVKRAFNAAFTWAQRHKVPILITYVRFTNRKELLKFTKDQSNYQWSENYYRQQKLKTWEEPLIYYCDLKKMGCAECKNCAILTYNVDTDKIYGINLSASGECKFNCPSCYAKKLIKAFGISYDNITQNKKQKGMVHG